MIARVRGRDRILRRRRVQRVVPCVDLHRDGGGARLAHGLEGRDEGRGRHDHLVSRADVRRQQREAQGIEAAREPDAVLRGAVLGECLLELRDGRAVRECVAVDQPGDVVQDVVFQRPVRRPEVEERDADRVGPGHQCRFGHALNLAVLLSRHHSATARDTPCSIV